MSIPNSKGLPRWVSGKESTCQMQETQETQVQSLDQKDPLEKEVATLSSILAWGSHGQKSLEVYSSQDYKRVGHNLVN